MEKEVNFCVMCRFCDKSPDYAGGNYYKCRGRDTFVYDYITMKKEWLKDEECRDVRTGNKEYCSMYKDLYV